MKHRNSSVNGIHEVGSRVKFPAETFTLLRSCDFPRISHGRTIVFIWGGLLVRLFFYLVSGLYWATVFHSRVRTVYECNSNGWHQLSHRHSIYPIIYLFFITGIYYLVLLSVLKQNTCVLIHIYCYKFCYKLDSYLNYIYIYYSIYLFIFKIICFPSLPFFLCFF